MSVHSFAYCTRIEVIVCSVSCFNGPKSMIAFLLVNWWLMLASRVIAD